MCLIPKAPADFLAVAHGSPLFDLDNRCSARLAFRDYGLNELLRLASPRNRCTPNCLLTNRASANALRVTTTISRILARRFGLSKLALCRRRIDGLPAVCRSEMRHDTENSQCDHQPRDQILLHFLRLQFVHFPSEADHPRHHRSSAFRLLQRHSTPEPDSQSNQNQPVDDEERPALPRDRRGL